MSLFKTELEKHFNESDKPKLGYQSPEDYIAAYSSFYDEVLQESEVLQD